MERTLLEQFAPGVWNPDDDPVELCYLPDDLSQANDLPARGEAPGARPLIT